VCNIEVYMQGLKVWIPSMNALVKFVAIFDTVAFLTKQTKWILHGCMSARGQDMKALASSRS
jgi:hypothetical protein